MEYNKRFQSHLSMIKKQNSKNNFVGKYSLLKTVRKTEYAVTESFLVAVLAMNYFIPSLLSSA